jgi:hypothetical protein
MTSDGKIDLRLGSGELKLMGVTKAHVAMVDKEVLSAIIKTKVSPRLCRGDSQWFDRALQ